VLERIVLKTDKLKSSQSTKVYQNKTSKLSKTIIQLSQLLEDTQIFKAIFMLRNYSPVTCALVCRLE